MADLVYSPSTGHGQYPPQPGPGYPIIDMATAAYPPPGQSQTLNPSLLSSSDKDVENLEVKFEQSIKQRQKDIHGIAIVLGVVDSSGPHGTDIDIDNVKETFEGLGFGVWVVRNPTAKQIAAAVHIGTNHYYMYETWCKCIVFYFAGHGGSYNGKGYVIPAAQEGDNPDPKYYIDEGIVYPFQPNQAPKLGSRFRLFFFDCCLKQGKNEARTFPTTSDPPNLGNSPSSLPPRGQCLVAYATSLHYPSSGNYLKGGVWTNHLCKNIKENVDSPLSTILDMTYDDVVEETNLEGMASSKTVQGPHYNSSIGLFYLKEPFKRARGQSSLVQQTVMAEPMSTVSADDDDDDVDIDDIMDKFAQPNDLKHVLKDMETNKLWKKGFGKRLVQKKILSESELSTCLQFKYMIDFLDRNQRPLTWGKVIEALESPYDLEIMKNREKIKLADSVRDYLAESAIFHKYKKAN